MTHGDLKGVRSGQIHYPTLLSLPVKANILVNKTGHARLADFGLLTIISDPANLLSSSSHTQAGTVRWMSPERIAPEQSGFENGHPTKSSDCYALGMVIYETVSGNLPFHKHTYFQVSLKVIKGGHPCRGVGFTEDLWKMLEQCWAFQPSDRPNIEDVLQCLEAVSKSLEPPPVEANEEMGDGDARDSTTNGFSGVSDGAGGIVMTESTTTISSDLSYPTDTPLSPAPTASVSKISVDSNNGGPHQVTII